MGFWAAFAMAKTALAKKEATLYSQTLQVDAALKAHGAPSEAIT